MCRAELRGVNLHLEGEGRVEARKVVLKWGSEEAEAMGREETSRGERKNVSGRRGPERAPPDAEACGWCSRTQAAHMPAVQHWGCLRGRGNFPRPHACPCHPPLP